MITEMRRRFNAAYSDTAYDAFVRDLNAASRFPMDFHVCETPLFLPRVLLDEMLRASASLLAALESPAYRARASDAIPPGMNVPNETPHTHFFQTDFGLCRDSDGQIVPRLIELQGFPTLFGFQWLLDRLTRRHFPLIDDAWACYLNDHDADSYVRALRGVVVADHDPETVILLEINPDQQKTRIDFALTEQLLGIQTVNLTAVIRRGDRLFYRHPVTGTETPITRIYNRVIFDELGRHDHAGQYHLTDTVDVTWAGHPNWFFKFSKWSLPFLNSLYVPACHFVSDLEAYPDDLSDFVLKPLYSYSGMGVELDVTPALLDSIPADRRNEYLLQRKVEYAAVVDTPDESARVEVRLMYIWPEGQATPEPMATLVRMSKGRMMGTRYNKDRRWVGSSLAYFPR